MEESKGFKGDIGKQKELNRARKKNARAINKYGTAHVTSPFGESIIARHESQYLDLRA